MLPRRTAPPRTHHDEVPLRLVVHAVCDSQCADRVVEQPLSVSHVLEPAQEALVLKREVPALAAVATVVATCGRMRPWGRGRRSFVSRCRDASGIGPRASCE
jgi:hypothetical protein